jgi:hypothetical protein
MAHTRTHIHMHMLVYMDRRREKLWKAPSRLMVHKLAIDKAKQGDLRHQPASIHTHVGRNKYMYIHTYSYII